VSRIRRQRGNEKRQEAKSKKEYKILCQERFSVTSSEWRGSSTVASNDLWEVKGH
jgi:hypothetical protein